MSKVNLLRRCFNCGAILQTEDEKGEGFISDANILSSPLNQVTFCDKCAAEIGFSSPSSIKAGKDLITILKDAAASGALIVYIADLFSFESSFIPEVNETIKYNPILVVANKRDLFMNLASDDFLKEYVAHRFRVSHLRVNSGDIILTSLVSFSNNDFLTQEIEKRRKGHDVYVIASRGAGKSMFFSSFLYCFVNHSNRSVITKAPRGTNTPVMQIPLDNSATLFDTPALSDENSLLSKLDNDVALSLLFSSPIKMKRFILKKNEVLALGGVCFIELRNLPIAERVSEIHLFVSPSLTVNKMVPSSKGTESLLPAFLLKKGIYPKSPLLHDFKDFDVMDIEVEEKGDRSIGIEGLGWFSYLGNRQVFRVYVPKGVSVYSSRSKILTYGNCGKE